MFHTEMDLELGVSSPFAPSDLLLFPDDLLNVPVESLNGGADSDIVGSSVVLGEKSKNTNGVSFFIPKDEDEDLDAGAPGTREQDLLEQVINEIKMTSDFDMSEPAAPLASNGTDTSLASVWPDEQEDADLKDLMDVSLFVPEQQQHPFSTPTAALSPASSQASLPAEDETQNLIDEVEEFLVHHENNGRRSSADDSGLGSLDNSAADAKNETADAERLLDALVRGNVSMDGCGGDDCSGINLSNVSEIVTSDGQRIVIVIAKDDEVQTVKNAIAASSSPAASPVHNIQHPGPSASPASSVATTSDDSDWSPYSPVAATTTKKASSAAQPKKTAAGRVSKPRGPYNKRSNGGASAYNVRDKKERKKLQNVVAARRYRDKKKSEQATVETEEQQLLDCNTKLKTRLAEMENEVNTLKKLMAELGLIKVNKK